MENISSRKNEYIRRLRLLSSDAAFRREQGEFTCQGMKMLREAMEYGAWIVSVLWKDGGDEAQQPVEAQQFSAPAELFDYACFAANSAGPVFTVKMPRQELPEELKNAVILDGVQDPGNVGTVIRTASAFDVDAVILTGDCADLYNPKTVSATMGAVFRQRVLYMDRGALAALPLKLYGAALSENAVDIRRAGLAGSAVVIGSEGHGISREVLELCAGQVLIPMAPWSESLNAAVAAGIAMWEMNREKEE